MSTTIHCVEKLRGQSGIQLIDVAPLTSTKNDLVATKSKTEDDDEIVRDPFSKDELKHAKDMLLKAHSPELIQSIETRCLELRQRRIQEGRDPLGFVGNIDEDTYVTTESFDVCLRATASWIRAVEYALKHENSPTAMSLTRPPGHHATFETANGFCLVNFAAAAAIHVMESHPDFKISIFDWDVHYGQGVAKILQKYDRARYVSIHQTPAFPYLGGKLAVSGEYNNILTIPIPADTTWTCGYRGKLEEHVLPFVMSEDWQPDIVLICAGYDALDSEELASVGLVARDFGEMITKIKAHLNNKESTTSVPIALGLEGGYQLGEMAGGGNLADAVLATLNGLLH
jgi:acetoin utilization deacetylase AcuC-like enzyme